MNFYGTYRLKFPQILKNEYLFWGQVSHIRPSPKNSPNVQILVSVAISRRLRDLQNPIPRTHLNNLHNLIHHLSLKSSQDSVVCILALSEHSRTLPNSESGEVRSIFSTFVLPSKTISYTKGIPQ